MSKINVLTMIRNEKIPVKTAIALLLLIYIYFTWNYLVISNDALYQLTVLNNNNYGFGLMDNLIINKNYIAEVETLKWWTPFSYLAPYLVSKLTSLSYSHSISICVIISTILSCTLLVKLSTLFNTGKRASLWLIIIFMSQRTININYLQFSGGDIFIYPIAIYQFIYFYRYLLNRRCIYFYPILLICSIIGVLFKMNYIIYSLSMLGVCFFNAIKKREYKEIIYQIFFGMILSALVLFFSTGPGTAVNVEPKLLTAIEIPQYIIVPAIGVFYSFFGINSILANIPSRQNTYFDVMSSWTLEGTIVGFVILLLSVWIFRKQIFNNVALFLFFSIYALFYSALYIKGSYVGHEDRYFFIPSLLFFMFVVSKTDDQKFRNLIFFIGMFFSSYGLMNFAYRIKEYGLNDTASINHRDFNELRVPISSSEVKDMNLIGRFIENKYRKYAVYTTNERYFYLNTDHPLIHDWNFQIMGFEKFDDKKFGDISILDESGLEGLLYISIGVERKIDLPAVRIGDNYIYILKNHNNDK